MWISQLSTMFRNVPVLVLTSSILVWEHYWNGMIIIYYMIFKASQRRSIQCRHDIIRYLYFVIVMWIAVKQGCPCALYHTMKISSALVQRNCRADPLHHWTQRPLNNPTCESLQRHTLRKAFKKRRNKTVIYRTQTDM